MMMGASSSASEAAALNWKQTNGYEDCKSNDSYQEYEGKLSFIPN